MTPIGPTWATMLPPAPAIRYTFGAQLLHVEAVSVGAAACGLLLRGRAVRPAERARQQRQQHRPGRAAVLPGFRGSSHRHLSHPLRVRPVTIYANEAPPDSPDA